MNHLIDDFTPSFFKKITSNDMNLLFVSFSFSHKILSLFLLFSVFISAYSELTTSPIQNGWALFFIITLSFLWISIQYAKKQLGKFKKLDVDSKQSHLFAATLGLVLLFFATIVIIGILHIL